MSRDPSLGHTGAVRCRNWSLGVGCLALAACALGAVFVSPAQFYRAYLAAYIFFLGVSLGSMAILMLYHLTGGAWGYMVRRILEAQMKTLPLLAVLFIPIALGLEHLYLWAQPATVAGDAKLQYQQFYLNQQFFLWRAAGYFAVWLLTAFMLSLRSRRQDRTGDPRLPWKFQRLSEIGLVLYGTTIHFAAFDWIETLQPTFHSTIFPFMIAAGQVLTGQAFVIAAFVWIVLRTPAGEILSTRALNDLGNMLFAFLIIWGYMVWFQFMLIWIANMPSDVLWYAPRSRDGWQWVAWSVFVVQFAVPLFLLLMRTVKGNPKVMAPVAGVILFMQLVYDYYLVLPPFHAMSITDHWIDFLTPIGIGGVWLAFFLYRLEKQPLLALNDPNRASALHLCRLDEEDLARERALAHG